MIEKMTAPHVSGRPGRNDGADREKRIYVLEEIENTRVRAALLRQHAWALLLRALSPQQRTEQYVPVVRITENVGMLRILTAWFVAFPSLVNHHGGDYGESVSKRRKLCVNPKT